MSASPGGLYGVIGHPVEHSLSPLIHRQFAADTAQSLSYDLLPSGVGEFAVTLADFFSGAPQTAPAGLNVTLPFKEHAATWVDRLDPAARLAGAVNTIRRADDGSFDGFNTDGSGLLADLQNNLGWSIADARILLIGAGGASRGALDALLGAHPSELVLANRTVSRAEELVAQIAPAARQVSTCAPSEVDGAFDIVINATSASLDGQGALVPTVAVQGARCYDMLYAPTQTVFSGWALSHGATWAVDGLGMLLEQAAAAFEIWRGVRPGTTQLLERRNDLFAAKRAGYDTLAGWLDSAEYQRWQSDQVADQSLASDAGRDKRQFIAGAVCPECREVDRIVVRLTAEGREQTCVACGYAQAAPDSAAADGGLMLPQGRHERGTKLTAQPADPEQVQAVRFIDPGKSADSTVQTNLPTSAKASGKASGKSAPAKD